MFAASFSKRLLEWPTSTCAKVEMSSLTSNVRRAKPVARSWSGMIQVSVAFGSEPLPPDCEVPV